MNQSYSRDPLREDNHEPIKGLVWKYGNRVLLELTLACKTYCPFCTRKRKVGKDRQYYLTKKELNNIFLFIKKNKKINEVMISGGDPVMVPDYLKITLKELNKIENVKVIRIHTKAPEFLNFKVDKKPIYVSMHLNRMEEINEKAILKLRKAGAIMLSQTVFVKSLNDKVGVLEKLFSRLIELGVRPYYIYHCDNVVGLEKYQVEIEKEKKIMRILRKRMSGLACPTHVMDSSRGKVVLL